MKRVEELIKEYDAIVSAGRDDETEKWIVSTCEAYDRECPDDIAGRCALYNEAGSFYRHRDRAQESIAWFLRAKELMETPVCEVQSGCKTCYYIANIPDEYFGYKETVLDRTVNYANTINNLAGAYRLTGQFEEAKAHFEKAIEIYEQNPDIPEAVLCSGYNNLALVYLDLANDEEAVLQFRKSLSVLEKTANNYYEKATTYANMSVAYYRMGKREESVDCLRKADELYLAGGLGNSAEYQAFLKFRNLIESKGS